MDTARPSAKPGPPPVLTRRGADVLLRVEKLLDDAGRSVGNTSATEAPKQPRASTALAFPENYAAAGDAAAKPTPAPTRKN